MSNTAESSRLFTIYTTSWCGDCALLKYWLKQEGYESGTDFTEIDIEQDAAAAEKVVELNNGNRSVPTLVFADGTVLTEPSIDQLAAQLQN